MIHKIILFFASAIIATINLKAQESKKQVAKAEDHKKFYYFEIPSAINGSNLDPSPISNVSSNFTDSRLSLKLGFPSVFKDPPPTKDLIYTGFFQTYVRATNGVATLWRANSQPVEYGVTGGLSRILSHNYWVFLDEDGNQTDRHSSESMNWLNLIANLESGNYNLFNPNAAYNSIVSKQTETNGGLYLTFNRYFFSRTKKHRWKSSIWSIGFGYAKTNNYQSLKSRTYEEGKLAFNSDSSQYQTVVETTSGRNGTLEIFEGLTGIGELFIPIIRDKKFGGLFFGNRLTYYGIGKEKKTINGNTGFYINLKDKKVEGDKPAKDIVNFSLTAQFLQLNKISEKDYVDNNISIQLQASIPLRFN